MVSGKDGEGIGRGQYAVYNHNGLIKGRRGDFLGTSRGCG